MYEQKRPGQMIKLHVFCSWAQRRSSIYCGPAEQTEARLPLDGGGRRGGGTHPGQRLQPGTVSSEM